MSLDFEMRLLFVHDHRFRRGLEGQHFTIGSFPSVVWERYLRHFDKVDVLGRDGGDKAPGENLALASHPAVRFELASEMTSPLQKAWPSRALWRQVKEAVRRADAVVARLPSQLGFLSVRAARQMGKPYAIEVVGCTWDGYVYHGSLAARLYAPISFLRLRHAVKSAPLALYVTSNWLQERYPTNGFSSYASNVEIIPMDSLGLESREQRLKQIAAGLLPRLGTVASLDVQYKGIQTAIAALERMRSKGLDLSYAVLGAGDPMPWQKLAEEHGVADLISFDGTREAGDGVRKWLDGIDIHLQPSFQEGLPRATVEAMSRGVACIGSTCGGIPELLAPERTHEPGDVDGLARAIEMLVQDPQKIIEASIDGRNMSRNFEPEVLTLRRDEIYGRLRSNCG